MTLVTDVLYVYTIQGFMHAQTLDNNHDYIVNLAPRPDGSPRPLEGQPCHGKSQNGYKIPNARSIATSARDADFDRLLLDQLSQAPPATLNPQSVQRYSRAKLSDLPT